MSNDYHQVFTNMDLATEASEKLKAPILNWMNVAAAGMETADLALTQSIKHLSALKQEAVKAKSTEGEVIFQDFIDHLTDAQSDLRKYVIAGLSDQPADVKFFQDLAEKVVARAADPQLEGVRLVRREPNLKIVKSD